MFVKRALLGLFAAVVLSLCLFAIPQPAKALSGTPSLSYPMTNNDVNAIVVAPDGSTYIGGSFATVGSTPRNRLAHILADGTTVDPAFDPDIDGTVTSLVLDTATGTLYVGGFFNNVNGSTPRSKLAAVNAVTGVATIFDPNITGVIYSLALDSGTNTLYAGGSIVDVNGGTVRTNLAAFNTTTAVATAFDPNIDGTVYALELDTTSSLIYAGGQFSTVNGATPRNNLAAFSTASATAAAFDPDIGGSSIRSLDLDSVAGTLYAGGSFTTVNGATPRNNLAAFSTASATATAFDPDISPGCLSPPVSAVLLSGSGTLYVSGCYFTVNGVTTRNALAEFSLTTSIATAFDAVPQLQPLGSGGGVFALALSPAATSLYVGGKYSNDPGFADTNLLCFGSCIAAPTPPGPTPTPTPVSTATLAPTGNDTKLPIGIALASFTLGSLGLWLAIRKPGQS